MTSCIPLRRQCTTSSGELPSDAESWFAKIDVLGKENLEDFAVAALRGMGMEQMRQLARGLCRSRNFRGQGVFGLGFFQLLHAQIKAIGAGPLAELCVQV